MNIVSELTIKALEEQGIVKIDYYSESLRSACEAYPPPFGMKWYGDKYRQLACNPTWFASSLIGNSVKEAEGSQKLWELAGQTNNQEVAEQIRLHAIDEARHSRLYIQMLDLVFPASLENQVRTELENILPKYTFKDYPKKLSSKSDSYVLDSLIQMNIGEIRTRINQLLLRPIILAYCKSNYKDKLIQILKSLLEDETKHITYTAKLIDHAAARGCFKFVNEIMHERLDGFNQITLDEVGKSVFEA
jgi:hypothetical protein